ncbi:phosphoribosylformylglycinamidine synthase-associated small membrane protein [uncultured Roseibium sp.]
MNVRQRPANDDTVRIVRFVAIKAGIFIVLPMALSALAVYLML